MAVLCRALLHSASHLLTDPVEAANIDDRTIRWLRQEGIGIEVVASPTAIGAARLSFGSDSHYRPNPLGVFALIFPTPADPATTIGFPELYSYQTC